MNTNQYDFRNHNYRHATKCVADLWADQNGDSLRINSMGGDYRGRGNASPQKIVWGRKRKRPPIIAPFIIFLNFHFDYCIIMLFSQI